MIGAHLPAHKTERVPTQNIQILVITNISVFKFHEYIRNIDRYFYKKIGKMKINKNTLKILKIFC